MLGIYARVSTDAQAEKDTIELQLELAREFCTKNNITDFEIYKDDGVSGAADIDNRPGLLRLLDDIKSGKIDSVWAYSVDRLSRNNFTYVVILQTLKKHNVKLFIKDDYRDVSNPTDTFILNILNSVAEYEREVIKIRTKLGRDKLKNQGLYHKNLFGYKKVGRDSNTKRVIYEPDFDKLNIMKNIYENLLKGIGANTTLRKQYGITNSGAWADRIRFPEYAGYTRDANGNLIKSELYTPIIDFESWKKCQEVYEGFSTKIKTNLRKGNHLCSGLIKCSVCNRSYHITYQYNRQKTLFLYYKQVSLGYKNCSQKSNMLNKNKTDKAILFFYGFHILSLENFRHENTKLKELILEDEKSLEQLKQNLEKDINSESKKIDNIKKAIISGVDADLFKTELNSATLKIQSLKLEYEVQKKELDDKRKAIESTIFDNVTSLKEFYTYDDSIKREYLKKVIKSIKIDKDTYIISTHNNKHYIFNKKGLDTTNEAILSLMLNYPENLKYDTDFVLRFYNHDDNIREYRIEPLDIEFDDLDIELQMLIDLTDNYTFKIYDFRFQ